MPSRNGLRGLLQACLKGSVTAPPNMVASVPWAVPPDTIGVWTAGKVFMRFLPGFMVHCAHHTIICCKVKTPAKPGFFQNFFASFPPAYRSLNGSSGVGSRGAPFLDFL